MIAKIAATVAPATNAAVTQTACRRSRMAVKTIRNSSRFWRYLKLEVMTTEELSAQTMLTVDQATKSASTYVIDGCAEMKFDPSASSRVEAAANHETTSSRPKTLVTPIEPPRLRRTSRAETTASRHR